MVLFNMFCSEELGQDVFVGFYDDYFVGVRCVLWWGSMFLALKNIVTSSFEL